MLIRSSAALSAAPNDVILSVLLLMTPSSVLSQETFSKPQVISPETCSDVDALFARRDEVRALRLLPVKSREVHELYNSQRDDPKLVTEVEGYLGRKRSALASNRFPYRLPPGIEQYLVWTRLEPEKNVKLARFMASCLTAMSLTPADLILFERSTRASERIVKGTFRAVRHVHFWVRTS